MSTRPHPCISMNAHIDTPNTIVFKKGNFRTDEVLKAYRPPPNKTDIIDNLFLEVVQDGVNGEENRYFDVLISPDSLTWPEVKLGVVCHRVHQVYGVVTTPIDEDGQGGEYISFSPTRGFRINKNTIGIALNKNSPTSPVLDLTTYRVGSPYYIHISDVSTGTIKFETGGPEPCALHLCDSVHNNKIVSSRGTMESILLSRSNTTSNLTLEWPNILNTDSRVIYIGICIESLSVYQRSIKRPYDTIITSEIILLR